MSVMMAKKRAKGRLFTTSAEERDLNAKAGESTDSETGEGANSETGKSAEGEDGEGADPEAGEGAPVKIPEDWQRWSRTKRVNLARRIDPRFQGNESAANALIAREIESRS